MFLAIDIGNTQTVWGVFDKEKIIKQFRTDTKRNATQKEVLLFIKKITKQIEIDKFDHVLISSVVPQNDLPVSKALQFFFEQKPLFLNSKNIPIKIKYRPPLVVGSDRLVSAYAVTKLYKLPAIVVDLGTATTFNLISSKGEYLGGAIAPGLGTGANALFEKAARLRPVTLKFPKDILGQDSSESLNSGIVLGHLAMIEKMVEKFQQKFKGNLTVIVTGGWANLLKKHFPKNYIHNPDLTILGIRFLV